MIITKQRPPTEVQHLKNSCWAAVIESWSRADKNIPVQLQRSLYRRWGEGPTGGITPKTKIPVIAQALGLQWGGFRSSELCGYITQHLRNSYVFVAYTVSSQYTHAVLVYYLDNNHIAYMDPYRGEYIMRSRGWIEQKGPFAVMRRA